METVLFLFVSPACGVMAWNSRTLKSDIRIPPVLWRGAFSCRDYIIKKVDRDYVYKCIVTYILMLLYVLSLLQMSTSRPALILEQKAQAHLCAAILNERSKQWEKVY